MTTKRNDILPSPGFSDDDSAPASNLSSMQRAIVTIQKLRAKVENLERARTESIAIIGMACRFPGGANTPEAFFRLLEDGVDAVTEVPAERWLLEQESADSEGEERSLRWGAFLKDVDQFDAAFFGISPREAESLDPQQRLLLEVAWESLERAGQLPERLMGSKTGVFVGIWSLDYQQRVIAQDQEKLDAYCFTGNVLSTAAGRLAYTFGLQGPCMSVETACSSSLTALHLACQSLRQGESALALAGGVNLMLSPTTTKLLSKTQALSPDGRCKSFDARANGFVRGEGCGILVLKRLSDAERDGDTILALVRGSAINQDGRSTGLTAPNVLSQQALLRQALDNARLSPNDIGYVETHGTGTSLGDPIEMEAIKAVLGPPREKGATCILGAVKTNIGHLEAAAGVAGVIKVVLALQNEKIPGNVHFRSLNPRIDIKDTALEIAQVAKAWPPGIRSRCAGVSSFGISGTNAHIILEEAPRNLEEALFEEETSTCLLPISAKTPEALRDQVRAFHEMLTSPQAPRLVDIVHTASARRSHYVHRLSVVGNTREEMAEQLGAFLEGEAPPGVTLGQSTPARAKVVFVFSGQGSQWLGMGRQLYETDSSFRSVIDTCDNLMTTRLGWSILDELDTTEATSRVAETQVAQPLLFAIQIALVEMLRSWGISPDAMIGHSVGEIAAAHIAGILSLDEAIRLVALRGRIMQKATGMGKMVSVSVSADEAKNVISGYEDRVAIAAINDPGSVVLSGSSSAIDDIVVRCEKLGFISRPLRVNYAFHSPQMDTFERELVERLTRVDTRRATLAMYSTVIADCVDGKELDVHYWGRNLRGTVDFAGAIFAAIRDGYQLFLEVGPHPVLMANIQQCFIAGKSDFMVAHTMRRNSDQRRTLLEAIGTLYTRGCAPEWARVVPSGGKIVPIPTYAWQRERYWIEGGDMTDRARECADGHVIHPLLGIRLASSIQPNVYYWEQKLWSNKPAWIAEHLVQGSIVFPGAGYVEMVLSAGANLFGKQPIELQDISFAQMLSLQHGQMRTVQTVVSGQSDHCASFQIASRSRDSDNWIIHSTGTIRVDDMSPTATPTCWLAQESGCEMNASDHYQHMDQRGVAVGPTFRGLERLWQTPNDAVGVVRLTDGVRNEKNKYRVHPAFLDACFQALLGFMATGVDEGTYVPVDIERVRVFREFDDETWVHVKLRAREGLASQTVDMILTDSEGHVAAEFVGLRVQRIARVKRTLPSSIDDCIFAVEWKRQDLPMVQRSPTPTSGKWLMFCDSGGIGTLVASRLRQLRDDCTEVTLGDTYECRDANHYVIDYSNPDHYKRLIQDVFSNSRVCHGVLHLSSLDATTWDQTTAETLKTDARRIIRTALFATQTILRQTWRDLPRLVFVTRGAQAVRGDDDVVSPVAALLWGLGRTISLEHPALECLQVDLDPTNESIDVDALVNEVVSNDREDQVALRNDNRFVARLVRTAFDTTSGEPYRVTPDGTYLITGGLGGLGISVAEWLANQGARHIALLGRNKPSDAARKAIANLESKGVCVNVLHNDVSLFSSVQAAFEDIRTQMPALRGIIHAAGVVHDRTLLELTGDDFESVTAPKLYGAWNLHTCSLVESLDFLIFYSSAASLLGSPGQANYSAANATLDAISHARFGNGLPTMSIHWGPFSDVGMAASQSNRGQRLSSQGLNSISPSEGTTALARLLEHPRAEIGVLRLVPRQWLEFNPQAAAIPFFEPLAKERKTPAAGSKPSRFREKWNDASSAERERLLDAFILEQIGQIVRTEVSRIDKHGSFTNLGVDSLMSLELRNKLETNLGIKLASTVLFTYTTPIALISHVHAELQPSSKEADVTMKEQSTPDTYRTGQLPALGKPDFIADDDLLAAFDASIQDLKTDLPS